MAIVEDDMADLAAATAAADDLEALMLKLSRKPIVSLDDIDRMSDDLREVRRGQDAIRKHLIALRAGEGK